MGRYSGHGYKTTLDGLLFIDMSKLKEFGYLAGYRSGTLSWTNSFSDRKSSVGVEIILYTDNRYARLHYDLTDSDTGKKRSFDYRVDIVSTDCNYGGTRYWFLCPLWKNGQYCGRRVRKLYKRGDYFGCRQCLQLAYPSQNENPTYRHGFFGILGRQVKAEDLMEKIKVPYYKDRPTRKMRRVLKIMPTDQEVTFATGQALEDLNKGV